MAKNLVIIEAPNKAKKIKSYLGNDYDVVATCGHIADLPEKGLNVNIKKDFEPTYGVYPDKKEIVKGIIAKAKKAKIIYLMTDADREGEAIAWMVSKELPKGSKFVRVSSGSITKSAIQNAIKNAGDIDMDMVAAYETRRILDRLAGYKTSFLVKQATGGRSAGRTQSAGLRILSAREKEIQAFISEEYWPIGIELLTDENEKIYAKIKKPNERDIITEKDAKFIVNTIKGKSAEVSKFNKKEVKTRALAPFTTSSMYQSAAGVLKWKSDKTSKIAQKLYESGSITYHRTDSMFMVPEFVSEIRNYILNKHDSKYLPEKLNHFGNPKNAQEAHEACRVTDLSVKEYTLGSSEENALYKLIWKRTVASQMTDMRKLSISSEFKIKSYIFSATGSKMLFDGWRKVWNYGEISDTELPELEVGEELKIIDVATEQKFTQPPPRYTERSFLKQLEQEGIGRPSTYASIIKTLDSRDYIENKKSITVTVLGLKVDDFLISVPFCFSDIGFSAEMEKSLDDILQKTQNKTDVLTKFWDRLKSDISKAEAIKAEKSKTSYECPVCKKKGVKAYLLLKQSSYGEFLSCENYSKKEGGCDYKANLNDNGKPVDQKKKEYYEDYMCPLCEKNGIKSHLCLKKSRYGEFLSCENYSKDGDGCDYKANINADGEPVEQKKKEYCKDWKCPECGSKLVKRKSKMGEFWGCEGYSKGCSGKLDLKGEILEFKNKKKKFKRKSPKKH